MRECPRCTEDVNHLSDHFRDGWTCEGLPAAPCSAAIRSLKAALKSLWAVAETLDLANPSPRKRHRIMRHISDAMLSVGQAEKWLKNMKQNKEEDKE